MKDWLGNGKTTFIQLGASNHSKKERENNDYYATDPKCLKLLLEKFKEDKITLNHKIWECSCGEGHLSNVLIEGGYEVYSTDLVNRNYGVPYIDFLQQQNKWSGDILTNPPYKYAKEFVEHSMELLEEGNKCIMFLKIQFLESKNRRKMFEKYPPKYVYVFSERQICAMNGDFEKNKATAICYCWYVWEKGFKGEPVIRWI